MFIYARVIRGHTVQRDISLYGQLTSASLLSHILGSDQWEQWKRFHSPSLPFTRSVRQSVLQQLQPEELALTYMVR